MSQDYIQIPKSRIKQLKIDEEAAFNKMCGKGLLELMDHANYGDEVRDIIWSFHDEFIEEDEDE